MAENSKEEAMEFLTSLQAIAANSNSDTDFLQILRQFHISHAASDLRDHVSKQCMGVINYIDRLELERTMVARLLGL